MLRWWLFGDRRDTNLKGRILREYQSLCLLALSIKTLSVNRQRVRADIFFRVTVERFFFLTLDSIAFDNFPLSLNTLTLHISEEILGDGCHFCYSNKAHLLDF